MAHTCTYMTCSLHVLCSSFCTVLQFFWCRHSVPSRFLRGIFEVSCSLNRSIFFYIIAHQSPLLFPTEAARYTFRCSSFFSFLRSAVTEERVKKTKLSLLLFCRARRIFCFFQASFFLTRSAVTAMARFLLFCPFLFF